MSNVEVKIVVDSLIYNYNKEERDTIINGIEDKLVKNRIINQISSLTS